MASLQILNPVFSSISSFPKKSDFQKKILSFNNCTSFRSSHSQRYRICCATQEGDDKSNEEPPESLFMKELKRRGMTPTLDSKKPNIGFNEEIKIGEEISSFSTRNAVSTRYEKNLYNQRGRSMELNSEGLEGLVPRTKLLLAIGAAFFLGFWPLILSTIVFFSAVYLYFGPSFIHDGNTTAPQYTGPGGPYELLENERISQAAPRLN